MSEGANCEVLCKDDVIHELVKHCETRTKKKASLYLDRYVKRKHCLLK